MDAIGHIYLGDHAEAADLLENTTATMLPRNRAYYSVMYSTALVESGEVAAGITSFNRSVPLLLEMTSNRVMDKVRDFAIALNRQQAADAREARRIAQGLIRGVSHA